jgi:NAD(P)-dependent dehydrogenase (short-subunit alcohol dehydrogenase family)
MADTFFSGKVLAITGGASGMGLQAAKHLASKGCKVSIADIQEEGLRKAKEDIDSANGAESCIIVKTDVRSQTQVEAWITKTIEVFGRVDFCANLAAVVGKDILVKATEEITNEDWDFVLGVNLTGMMNSLRAQIPHLKSGAAIVNFASVSGQRGFAMNAAYCASKHAVIGLSKCTAKELGPKGIRLNIVCP